ncbi:MAG: DNA gyrase subunit A [Phycisphaerales bacterium]
MNDNDGGTVNDSKGDSPSGDAAKPNIHGNIVELDIQRELKDSYLTYAMSTIMDRALPDVRDGLKPSQRRILVSMEDLKLRPNKKHYKCAKIVGDASGNYHPHGTAALYGVLVLLAQKWRMRCTLVDPQGNFGSIAGDPPAAERYTEARMAHAAVDLLSDIDQDTVDFQPNYDDRLLEPTVLPGKFPNLLVNGGMGIAVGMATSLPPHNPTEVFDSIIRVLENPAVTLNELMTDVVDASGKVVREGIKGPDFPTGGVIHGRRGIIEGFSQGRGKVVVRGRVRTEEIGKDKYQLVIDEIPYLVAQDNLVEWIVDAIKEDKITDVSDVHDYSGREAQTKVVIELKKGADPKAVESQLYEYTPLQQTFSIANIALVNRQPKTLSLRELIDCYIDHRTEVIRRRTAFQLRDAKKRAHLLECMILAVCDIDEVIREIKASKTREEAIERLMSRRFTIPATHPNAPKIPDALMKVVRQNDSLGGVLMTRVQAEHIGNMRLFQLVGLEIDKLVSEYREVVDRIAALEGILASQAKVFELIKADCEEMRAKFGSPRRTTIEESGGDIAYAELVPVENVALTISHQGYVKRVPLDTYRQQSRGGKGIRAGDTRGEDDFIEHLFVASTHDDLLCFTNTGRVFKIKVFEIPEMNRTSIGRAIVNLIQLKEGERTCAYLAIKNFEEGSNYLTFVTRNGIVKRTALKEYRNVSAAGLIAVGLKEGDSLLDVTLTDGQDDLLLATAGGMAIRFNEQDARLMGRPAEGVKGIELDEDDQVIGLVRIPMKADAEGDLMTADPSMCLLTVTDKGKGKRTLIDEYRVQPESGKLRSQSRGGKGRVDIKLNEKNGRSVAALPVMAGDDVVVITRGGQLVRMPVSEIRECGRGSQGVNVARVDDGDSVISAATAPESEKSEGDAAAGESETQPPSET